MKKLLIVLLIMFLSTPAFAAMKIGATAGLGFLPSSALLQGTIDGINAGWLETEDNPGAGVSVEVDEVSYPKGIGLGLKAFLSHDLFIADLSLAYFGSMGGAGSMTAKMAGVEAVEEYDFSVSALTFCLMFGPKINVNDLTAVYLKTGPGIISVGFDEKKTISAAGTVDEGASYDREFSGSAWFLPIALGMDVKLADKMSVGAEAIYRNGTVLLEYNGKRRLDSAEKRLQHEIAWISGMTILFNFNYYLFSM